MASVLAIMGSPRKNGTSDQLLNLFMAEFQERPLTVEKVDICDLKISGCKGCRFCEKSGVCKITDDMDHLFYLLKQSDLVILSTPVFFYNFPSQLKAVIDRCQTLWARRYRLGLKDPKQDTRKGFVIAAGATKGKNLFSGIELTAKYFFDSVSARFEGLFGLRNVESPEDLSRFPDYISELKRKAKEFADYLAGKKKVCFVCRENSCRSQMAEAFLQNEAENEFFVFSAGDNPDSAINPSAIEVMAEVGLDIKFRRPKSTQELIKYVPFDLVVTMGCETYCPAVYAKKIETWEIEDPKGKSIEKFREVRDLIFTKVKELLEVLKCKN